MNKDEYTKIFTALHIITIIYKDIYSTVYKNYNRYYNWKESNEQGIGDINCGVVIKWNSI